ncbi:MAG TPA: dehydrogenase, partial [Franconibacter helveticus]|nr:dehydrogenase [Franconibacter helveticus]
MKHYALVGTGGRAGLYIDAIGGKWRESAKLVAFCDSNQTRMQYANGLLEKAGAQPASLWQAEHFEAMIRETRPETII